MVCRNIDDNLYGYLNNSFLIIQIDVIEGYNETVFAYGQTGSGKTHTMMVSINKFYLYAIAALEGPAKAICSTVLNPACLVQFSKSESV